MKQRRRTSLLIATMLILPVGSASAWGPVTQISITTTAAHVLARDDEYPLTKLLQYVRQGAEVSPAVQNEMHPLFEIDSVGAIQREMFLLQSVRGDRVDPYFVYRLGVLGKLVVQASAPLANSGTRVRELYYADVERGIDGVGLEVRPRKHVDPRAYFTFITSEASKNDQTIIIDYQGGIGFRGYAASALSIDASRSVNAVADVWYTILSSAAPAFELSPSNMREYTLGAVRFYLSVRNLREVDAAYEKAEARGILTIDVQKSIGDLFFDAGLAERAIDEYRKVLTRSPGRRDVTERMSRHYELVGDEALSHQNLKDARDAYAKALQVDSLHPLAQRKLFDVEARIFARDERLVAQRIATDEAGELENRAKEAAIRRDYAQAIALLRQAEQLYGIVTDEFPVQARTASIGLRNVVASMRELKQELITNAQSLSGTGFRFDARHLAAATGDKNQQALQDMLSAEYGRALQELRRQVTTDLGLER
ncbi:MAG: hypothetical protein IID09_03325 [Candidatus Hydrogenedentes bacterium]|nr:hypothetical protein [Candidatus Hydrogenedentota bacterium]